MCAHGVVDKRLETFLNATKVVAKSLATSSNIFFLCVLGPWPRRRCSFCAHAFFVPLRRFMAFLVSFRFIIYSLLSHAWLFLFLFLWWSCLLLAPAVFVVV